MMIHNHIYFHGHGDEVVVYDLNTYLLSMELSEDEGTPWRGVYIFCTRILEISLNALRFSISIMQIFNH